MTVLGNIYANFFDQAASGNINWASDSIKCALLGSGYTPNLATHIHWSDVSAQEIAGTGYTAGGVALASKTHTVTAANSWGTAWAASTAYAVGTIVHPLVTNGYIYIVTDVSGTGTSGSSAPAWTTVQGDTVLDNAGANQIEWTCIGESITQWSSAAASWTIATLSANFAVIYDAQTGTSTTEPLIALIQFGGAVSSTAATYTVTPNALGWFVVTPF